MVTVVAGTNRADSMTLRTARVYETLLRNKQADVKLLSLENREVWQREDDFLQMESEFLIPAAKFVFIMPEYNASFPGILKLMMDNSDIKKCWWYKKAALVGISDGRAGNLRGLEHMTSILHYMKVHVLYNKLVISRIKEEIDADGNIKKDQTALLMEQHVNELLQF